MSKESKEENLTHALKIQNRVLLQQVSDLEDQVKWTLRGIWFITILQVIGIFI